MRRAASLGARENPHGELVDTSRCNARATRPRQGPFAGAAAARSAVLVDLPRVLSWPARAVPACPEGLHSVASIAIRFTY